MYPFVFASDVPALSEENLIVEIGPQLADKEALLAWFADQLALPGYFGHNWDAFEECLGDLSWIEQQRIVLFHRGLPLTESEDQRIYLEVLAGAVHRWRSDPSHELVAVFESIA